MMAFLYICPFYTSDDPGVVRCDAGSIKFPNRTAGLWFRKSYCGSYNFHECTLAQLMSGYYEEMFPDEEEEDGREEECMEEDDEG